MTPFALRLDSEPRQVPKQRFLGAHSRSAKIINPAHADALAAQRTAVILRERVPWRGDPVKILKA